MRAKKFLCAVVFVLLAVFPVESFALQFGAYYQEENSISPVDWRVIDEDENSYLLLSEKCLDQKPYNERREKVSWENCTLNQWLNSEFLATAFNASERSAIMGKIFLLSHEEIIKYFPTEQSRQCSPTSFAKSRGVYVNARGLCAWWTKSRGQSDLQADYLSSAGGFGSRPHYVDDDVIGVRPALRVKKDFFSPQKFTTQ